MTRPSNSRRSGTILILVVMVVFALMALAALTIDLGLARWTQRQMQTAVDSAALEGLRLSDPDYPNAAGMAASAMVTNVFIDNYQAATGSDRYQFGAGPNLTLSGGIPLGNPGFSAAQYIDPAQFAPADSSVYKPSLQPNPGNAPYGDVVLGIFATPANGAPPNEDSQYNRNDFTAVSSGATASGTAYLVRLRRTGNLQGLDNVSGVSSSAPPLPYLFGRGSLLAPQSKGAGITVRATGIADSRPAKSVGPAFAAAPNGGPAIDGHPPVALRLDVWETFGAGPLLLSLDGNGTGSMNGGAGWAIDSSRLLSVGTQIDTSPVQQTTLPTVLPNAVYIPIFEPITNPTTMAVERFLVGFGRVMIVSPPPTAQTVTIQRVRGGIAGPVTNAATGAILSVANVSAAFIRGRDAGGSPLPLAAGPTLNQLFTMNESLRTDSTAGPLLLLAPALVR